MADHLSDDGALGGVFRDGAEDVGVWAGVDVDAKVLGDVEVSTAEGGDGAEEGEVGDVLHGGQQEGRTVRGEHGVPGERC